MSRINANYKRRITRALMITKTLSQPETQLGNEIAQLLADSRPYKRIVFVSAFTALKTILRLREGILGAVAMGSTVQLTLGIDLGGTSRDVLHELLSWDCEVFIYHNPIPRATFHPKIYLFERESDSTLFLGSNNLTDGGLFTNYEAATQYSFTLPSDANEYNRILQPLRIFLDPSGPTVRRLNDTLIATLSARGMLTTEAESRRGRRISHRQSTDNDITQPPNPFTAVATHLPPLLPSGIRNIEHDHVEEPHDEEVVVPPQNLPRPNGVLVWQKVLPRTDALQVRPGSHPVGGVRLTQARFENPPGNRIDQTTYFRRLFDEYDWEPEQGRHIDQEHTFIPFRVIIRASDYGIRNFEISHKPSGESGQDNYTTILRWGRNFNNIIRQANISNAVFSLYETPDAEAPFFIEITDK